MNNTLNQYNLALEELLQNPESRRAIMIYTRPSMWLEYNKDGRSDFMCTNDVQYLIRDGSVHAVVQMRSNDAWAGYRNDRAWQQHVLEKITAGLNAHGRSYQVGNLYWNAGSLHVYARNYYLVDHASKTGELTISKPEYGKLYPNSPYK
jgi:thymidylate synthase